MLLRINCCNLIFNIYNSGVCFRAQNDIIIDIQLIKIHLCLHCVPFLRTCIQWNIWIRKSKAMIPTIQVILELAKRVVVVNSIRKVNPLERWPKLFHLIFMEEPLIKNGWLSICVHRALNLHSKKLKKH